MLKNFILQYILIGAYVASAYDFRFFEIPQNREFFTSKVEEKPPEKKNSMLSTNNEVNNYSRDILDFIRTLDSLIERTANEIKSNLESENNALLDSAYDNDDIYNDIGLNKFRQRRHLPNESTEVLSTKEEVYPKKGFSNPNTPHVNKVNESLSFPRVFEHLDNRSFPHPANLFKLQNGTETSNKISTLPLNLSPIAGQNVPWALNSSDEISSVIDATKKIQGPYTEDGKLVNRSITDELKTSAGDSTSLLNGDSPQQPVLQVRKLELNSSVTEDKKIDPSVGSNTSSVNKLQREVRIQPNLVPPYFDLFDDVKLAERLENVNHKNHLQEFGKYGLIEDNAQNKKINTILQKMGDKNSGPIVAYNPTNEEIDGSDKGTIFAITMLVVGSVIFVGFVGMVAFAYLKMRRENSLRSNIFVAPPMSAANGVI